MYTRSTTKDIWSLPTSYSNGVYNFNVATTKQGGITNEE